MSLHDVSVLRADGTRPQGGHIALRGAATRYQECSSNSTPASINDAPRRIIGGPLQGPDPFMVIPFTVG